MRVLVLAIDLYPSKGGVQRYTHTLCSALGQLYGRSNVHVLSLLDVPRNSVNNASYTMLARGSKVSSLWAKSKFVLQGSFYALRNYDFIIYNHINLAPIVFLSKWFGKTGYAFIAYGIEVWGDLNKLQHSVLSGISLTISLSNFTKDMLINTHKVNQRKVKVINPCIDPAFLNTVNSISTSESSIPVDLGEHKVLLTVARLSSKEQYKGHDTVIRALPRVIESIPNIKYLIVGDGDDKERIAALARQLRVEDHIIFAGARQGRNLLEYYQACDVFVMPSRVEERNGKWSGEGFGIVYIEAAAFGKPVVAGKYGGSAEAVLDGETGFLVDPTDVGEVASTLIRLLKDRNLAKRMGKRGREWVTENFTFEVFKKNLERVLQECGF